MKTPSRVSRDPSPAGRRSAGRHRIPATLGAGLALIAALASAVASPPAPALSFAADSVQAASVSPGGCAIFLSVSRQALDWRAQTVPRVVPAVDTDGDGEVVFDLAGGVVEKSIWAVVDFATGGHSVAGPSGEPPLEAVSPVEQLFAVPGRLIDRRDRLELLVVRPGKAAWYGRFYDGGTGDAGPESDGQVEVVLATLQQVWPTIGKVFPLKGLQAGDVVVGIDPTYLAYYVENVSAPAIHKAVAR